MPLRIVFNAFCKFKVFGLGNINQIKEKKAIFISNHESYYDPFLIGIGLSWLSKFHPIYWLGGDNLFLKKNFLMKTGARLFGCFPGEFDRGLDFALKKPSEFLEVNNSIGIFPDKCYDEGLFIEKRYKLISLLSKTFKCPIVPVFMSGVEGLNWKTIFLKQKRITLLYGEPIYIQETVSDEKAEEKINQSLLNTRLKFIKLIHEEEKHFWNGYAQFYYYLERAKPYQDLVNEFDKNIPSKINGKWIDLGSGSGAIVDLLLKKTSNPQSAEILATDFDKTMLEHLSRRLNNNNLKIKELDLAMSFDLPDNFFDGVTANLVLTYIIHHEAELGLVGFTRLLEDIYKILKPGGKFIWSSPKKGVKFYKVFLASWKDMLNPRNIENLYYGPAILKQALRIQNWGKRGIYHFLDTKEIEKILKEVGFKNIKFSRSMANQVDIVSCEKAYPLTAVTGARN